MSTSTKKPAFSTPIFILVGLIALGVGLYMQGESDTQIPPSSSSSAVEINGTLLNTPRALSPFSLVSTKNEIFNQESLKGQWTYMFFGFSSCGYMCPKILTELNKTYDRLTELNVAAMPQFVMVSIDPERDSLTKLNEFVTTFNPNFIGARAEEDVIKALTKEIGVVYMKLSGEENKSANDYDIDHSGTVFLFNPDGLLEAFFSIPHKAEQLATDFITVEKHRA